MSKRHSEWMQFALDAARNNRFSRFKHGAVVVFRGKLIATAQNAYVASHHDMCHTVHAEVAAIEKAKSWVLREKSSKGRKGAKGKKCLQQWSRDTVRCSSCA